MPLTITENTGVRGFQIIESRDLINASNTGITLLDEPHYDFIRVMFNGLISNAARTTLYIRFNDDGDPDNYEAFSIWQHSKDNTSDLLDDNLKYISRTNGIFLGETEPSNGTQVFMSFTINNDTGFEHLGQGRSLFVSDTNNQVNDFISSGIWRNTIEDFEKVTLNTTGGGLITGRFTVLGLR